jgi:hypothetical protein
MLRNIIIFTLLISCLRIPTKPPEQHFKLYGTDRDDNAYSIIEAPDKNLVLVGWYGSMEMDDPATWRMFIIKVSPNGDEIWRKIYYELNLRETLGAVGYEDGIIAVSNSLRGDTIYLTKLDYNGNIIWDKAYVFPNGGGWGSDNFGTMTRVSKTKDGGIAVTGTICTPYVKGMVMLLKADKNGNVELVKNLGFVTCKVDSYPFEMGQAILQTSDGGYLIGAWGKDTITKTETYYTLKTDSLGNILWIKTYPHRPPSKFLEDEDGYVVCITGGEGIRVMKLDKNGNEIWSKRLEGMDTVCEKTPDGGYIIASSYLYYVNFYKLDRNGNIIWGPRQYSTASFMPQSLIRSSDNYYYLLGFANPIPSKGPKDAGDFFLMKIDENGNPGF